MKIKYSQIQLVCVMYIVTWMIAPPLAYDSIFRIIAVLAAITWLLLQHNVRHTVGYDYHIKQHIIFFELCVFVYCFFLYLFRVIYDQATLVGAFYTDIPTYILLFSAYLAATYVKGRRYDDLRKVFKWILFIAVFFSLTTIFRSSAYSELTRNAGGTEDVVYKALAREAAMHGVGAFGFFCFTSVLAPMLLWLILDKCVKKKKIYIISFIIVEIGVISAGYTLALLISIIGICAVIMFKVSNPTVKILIIGLLIIFVLFRENIFQPLYYVLKDIVRDTMYENKVDDIFSFLIEKDSTGSFAARQERYLMSWKSIINNPIMGSYFWIGTRAVGYHSSILDTFAAYGWIIGGAWLYLINIFPIKLSKSLRKEFGIIAFFLLFFTAFFNTYTMMMGVYYFVFPCITIISKEFNYS